MKTKTVRMIGSSVAVLAAIPILAATHYFQGFEIDTFDWSGVTRVASGTNGVTSAAGAFHAEAASAAAPNTTGDFTRFGGYESTFPAGGYTTSVDVYLNVGAGNANDTRFDWSSAIGMPDGTFRRDFVFNAGFYNDTRRHRVRSSLRDQRQQQRDSQRRISQEPRARSVLDYHDRVVYLRAPLPQRWLRCPGRRPEHQHARRRAAAHLDSERPDRHHRHRRWAATATAGS